MRRTWRSISSLAGTTMENGWAGFDVSQLKGLGALFGTLTVGGISMLVWLDSRTTASIKDSEARTTASIKDSETRTTASIKDSEARTTASIQEVKESIKDSEARTIAAIVALTKVIESKRWSWWG